MSEVYIRMMRGENSLVIDDGEPTAVETASQPIEFAMFDLHVVEADEAEAAPHTAMSVELEQASGGKIVWRVTGEVAMA